MAGVDRGSRSYFFHERNLKEKLEIVFLASVRIARRSAAMHPGVVLVFLPSFRERPFLEAVMDSVYV